MMKTKLKSRHTKKTSKAPCEVCYSSKISKSSGLYKLKYGDTILRSYFPKSNKLQTQLQTKNKNKITLDGLKPSTKIFYFATNHRDFTEPIQKFKDAYHHLENSGITKTNKKGECVVNIDCPQIYIAEDGQVYSRHLHLVYWDEKQKDWDKEIYTHQIFCGVSKSFVQKYVNSSNDVLIIDALPEDYFKKKHIKGAINLPAEKHWTLKSVMEHLPTGTHSTTPMILYCYSADCNAAEKLYIQLTNLGFYNTMHYINGISEWNGETN